MLKINLGCDCMTDESSEFISRYRKILNDSIVEVDQFLSQQGEKSSLIEVLKQSKSLMSNMASRQEKYDKSLDLYTPCHSMIYLLVRKLKPDKIVETGVQKGGSTYMILSGLDKNKNGTLWSIELRKWFVFNKIRVSRIGPLVVLSPNSSSLKSRWKLVLDDAQKILPSVLKDTGKLDIFMALQGHTYEVQKNEFSTSWHLLRSGGVFVLDRPDWNDGRYLQEILDQHGDEIAYCETFKEGSQSDPFEFTVIVKK